jgi:hypothetical protein
MRQALYFGDGVQESVIEHAPSCNGLMAIVHLLEMDRQSRAVANDACWSTIALWGIVWR